VAGRFRVVDTGVLEGRFNIAIDQAMIEAHQAGRIPDTIRFMRFPPTALIGRHQALRQEIDVDHCRTHGIGIVRRITGGGAIYLDEGQLGWGLVFQRKALGQPSLADVASHICQAVAAGLQRLGVDARYRPRNDIEVDGRKISGTGGFFDGDTLIYQGTVLVDMNPAAMVAALRVPRAKLEKRQLDSAAHASSPCANCSGQPHPARHTAACSTPSRAIRPGLGPEPRAGRPCPEHLRDEIGTASCCGGTTRATRLRQRHADGRNDHRLPAARGPARAHRQLLITGDFSSRRRAPCSIQ
jgi:lipoate-protein ligase A